MSVFGDMRSFPVITECLSHASLEMTKMSWYQFSGLQPCEKDGPRQRATFPCDQRPVQGAKEEADRKRSQGTAPTKTQRKGPVSHCRPVWVCNVYSLLVFLAFNHSRVSQSVAFGTLTVSYNPHHPAVRTSHHIRRNPQFPMSFPRPHRWSAFCLC